MRNRIFIIVTVFVGIVVFTLFSSMLLLEKTSIKELTQNEIKIKKSDKIDYFNQYIQDKESILFSILENEEFKKFITNRENPTFIKNLFLSFSRANYDMFQLRYIDFNGNEIIRVDRKKESVLVVDENLQNKKDRYYFKDSIKLAKNELYYSNIDLNIEHKKIEKPIVPTLRISTPVIIDDVKYGILIINLNLNNFLINLQKSSLYDISLIYDDEQIIVSNNSKYNWSRDYNLKFNIFEIYPNLPKDFVSKANLEINDTFISKLNVNSKNKIFIYFIPKTFSQINKNYSQMKNQIYLLIFITLLGLPLGYLLSGYIERIYKQKILFEKTKMDNILINSVINSTNDLIFYKDRDFKYIGCNQAFERFVGKNTKKIIGKTDFDLFDEEHANLFRKMDIEMLQKNDIKINNEWVKFNNNYKAYLQTKKIPFNYDKTDSLGILGISRDITDLFLAQEKIKEQTFIDELTNIYNRKAYNDKLQEKLDLFKRYNTSFCIIIYDIDNFKLINDTYGHDIGDKVLIKMTEKISQLIRKTDSHFRIGGEEFIVILPKTHLKNAKIVAEKIRHEVSLLKIIENKTITISLGVVEVNTSDDVNTIFKRADNLLYASKENGRNMVSF